jgi:hypothetical protein
MRDFFLSSFEVVYGRKKRGRKTSFQISEHSFYILTNILCITNTIVEDYYETKETWKMHIHASDDIIVLMHRNSVC